MNYLYRATKWIILFVIFAVWGFYTYPKIKEIQEYVRFEDSICKAPITYSIGSIDQRFNLTNKKAKDALFAAEEVWEKPTKKDLFTLHEGNNGVADIKIVFVYDKRQKITNSLNQVSGSIELKNSILETEKTSFTQKELEYKREVQDYNSLVAEYNRLARTTSPDSSMLSQMNKKISDTKNYLNKLEKELGESVQIINTQVDEVNNDIQSYNQVASTQEEVFEEGEYVKNGNSRIIYVYEFSEIQNLRRLLAHEFGHALGIEHVEGERSIMYSYNTSTNMTPTKEDLVALDVACSREPALKRLFKERLPL